MYAYDSANQEKLIKSRMIERLKITEVKIKHTEISANGRTITFTFPTSKDCQVFYDQLQNHPSFKLATQTAAPVTQTIVLLYDNAFKAALGLFPSSSALIHSSLSTVVDVKKIQSPATTSSTTSDTKKVTGVKKGTSATIETPDVSLTMEVKRKYKKSIPFPPKTIVALDYKTNAISCFIPSSDNSSQSGKFVFRKGSFYLPNTSLPTAIDPYKNPTDAVAYLLKTFYKKKDSRNNIYIALCFLLPEMSKTLSFSEFENHFSDKDNLIAYLIRLYVNNKTKFVKKIICSLKPEMKDWKAVHFYNYMSTDPDDEYSDDSDDEKNEVLFSLDEKLYSKDERKLCAGILEKTGNYNRDNLSTRLKKLIRQDLKVDRFERAADRRAYFPDTSLSAKKLIKNELEWINFAAKEKSLKMRVHSDKQKPTLEINGIYRGKEIKIAIPCRYYLPCFRGISYLVDRWSAGGRRANRRLPLNRNFMNYAEANIKTLQTDFYKLDDYTSIDLAALRENAKKLKSQLIQFKSSEPIIASSAEGKRIGLEAKAVKLREFQNYLDCLQYMFSNGIVNFLKHLQHFNKAFPGILPNNGNPLLPFSHLPFHAMKYAFGDKNPYSNFALPPLWDEKGYPRKPHIGKFVISIHPIKDFFRFDQPNVVPYLTKAAGITAGFDIGPEYEVSFLSYMPEDRFFKQRIIRYPSFHHSHCPTKYLAKYGLNETLYQGFRTCIINPTTRDTTTQILRTWLCLFHAIKALEEVHTEITARKGVMLFYHPEGEFRTDYPPEDYDSKSKVAEESKLAAKEHIVKSKIILSDEESWEDKRGFYTPRSPDSGVSSGPRTPPSGSTPKRKSLRSSLGKDNSPSYSSVSPSSDSSDIDMEEILSGIAQVLKFNEDEPSETSFSSVGHKSIGAVPANSSILTPKAKFKLSHHSTNLVASTALSKLPNFRTPPPASLFHISHADIYKIRDEKSAALFTHKPTKADGNCAIHAAFGSWNEVNQQYECELGKVAEVRTKIADSITTMTVNYPAYACFKQAVMQVIKDPTALRGGKLRENGAIQAKVKQLKTLTEVGEKKSTIAGSVFETELTKHPRIIDCINKQMRPNEIVEKNLNTLLKRFLQCRYRQNDSILKLVQEHATLHQAYEIYNRATESANFDWETVINDVNVKNEYIELIKTPGYWFSSHEVELMAYSCDITLDFYITDSVSNKTFLLKPFNPGKPYPITIRHDGTGHFERMVASVNTLSDTVSTPISMTF